MITTRPAGERGHGRHGWLDTRHTFSFGDYHDPRHTGFRALRVINDDRIAPGSGFGMHGHRDMEILTYVLKGELEHRDSLGNGAALREGELQCMTAGTGIRHGESAPATSAPVHLYQFWILPDREGLTPAYDQRAFARAERDGRLRVVASPDGRDGSLTIHQDALVFLSTLETGGSVSHALAEGRHAWLQVLSGAVSLNGVALAVGDGAAVTAESSLSVRASADSELMLFDLP